MVRGQPRGKIIALAAEPDGSRGIVKRISRRGNGRHTSGHPALFELLQGLRRSPVCRSRTHALSTPCLNQRRRHNMMMNINADACATLRSRMRRNDCSRSHRRHRPQKLSSRNVFHSASKFCGIDGVERISICSVLSTSDQYLQHPDLRHDGPAILVCRLCRGV